MPQTDPVDALIAAARKEPIGVDVSDWSDEWVAGFLRGQASILEELQREPERYGVGLIGASSGSDTIDAADQPTDDPIGAE